MMMITYLWHWITWSSRPQVPAKTWKYDWVNYDSNPFVASAVIVVAVSVVVESLLR